MALLGQVMRGLLQVERVGSHWFCFGSVQQVLFRGPSSPNSTSGQRRPLWIARSDFPQIDCAPPVLSRSYLDYRPLFVWLLCLFFSPEDKDPLLIDLRILPFSGSMLVLHYAFIPLGTFLFLFVCVLSFSPIQQHRLADAL